MSDIIIIGEVMIELAPLDDQQYVLGAAGDTYNTACTLQGLGFDPCYVTALGTGQQADNIRALCAARGVTVAEPPIDPERSPGLYLISNDETGERSFEYWRENSAARALFKQANALEALLEPLSHTLFCYFTGITLALMSDDSRRMLLAFLTRYRHQGGTVVFDPNYRPALWSSQDEAANAITAIQTQVDIYLPGFEEEAALNGFDSIDAVAADLLNREAGEVVVKNGAKGCTLITGGEMHEISVSPAQKIMDTTGAGDTFNGAYIAGRLSELAPSDAIAFAAKAAADVLQVSGGLLTKEQLAALKAQLKKHQVT
ncbi:MAG: 2-dehydro-3-deoxygluconokinase [Halioglobus sp.]|jgi:2-dehydro-3-deoxygluconokinase